MRRRLMLALVLLLPACGTGSSQEDIDRAVAAALASAAPQAASPSPEQDVEVEEQEVEEDVDLTEANSGEAALDGEFGALGSKRVTHRSANSLKTSEGLVYDVLVELYEPTRLGDTPCAEPPRDDRAASFPIKITFGNPASDRTLPSIDYGAFYQKVLGESALTQPRFFQATSALGDCGNGGGRVWELPPGVEYQHVGAFNDMLPGIATQPFHLRLEGDYWELEFEEA